MGQRVRGRVAVFGDVGGQLDEFSQQLRDLGADPETGSLPEDLTVVQLGDLIHRGPDSAGVVDLVGRFLHTSRGQWVQLAGNHEELYLFRPPRFRWPEQLPEDQSHRLLSWWRRHLMVVAAAIDTGDGPGTLVCHGGLTEGYWRTMIGSPPTAVEAADRLNRMAAVFKRPVFRAGAMLGNPIDFTAGPVWAEEGTELLPSWLQWENLPFDQIHGHSTVWDWRHGRVNGDPALADRIHADTTVRHVTTAINGHRITGIDPGHGTRPAPVWAPLVLHDALVVEPVAP